MTRSQQQSIGWKWTCIQINLSGNKSTGHNDTMDQESAIQAKQQYNQRHPRRHTLLIQCYAKFLLMSYNKKKNVDRHWKIKVMTQKGYDKSTCLKVKAVAYKRPLTFSALRMNKGVSCIESLAFAYVLSFLFHASFVVLWSPSPSCPGSFHRLVLRRTTPRKILTGSTREIQ